MKRRADVAAEAAAAAARKAAEAAVAAAQAAEAAAQAARAAAQAAAAGAGASQEGHAKKRPRKPTFGWAGALEDLRDRYTSVELQHEMLKGRIGEK